MGKFVNKTCYICQIRRPVYRMKQEVVTAKTGHIGFGLSFNPARKKSARIQLPRNRYSKSIKWVCNDKKAHGKPDYYDLIEKKRLQEIERQRIKKEKDERIKKITREMNDLLNSFLIQFDKNTYKKSLSEESDYIDIIDDNSAFTLDDKDIDLNLENYSNDFIDLIYEEGDHSKISSPKNLKKIVLDYSNQIIPNIRNTLRNKKIMRSSGWYMLGLYIILEFFGIGDTSFTDNPSYSTSYILKGSLFWISLVSILILTPYSFFYNRKESKNYKQISSTYYNTSSFISEDFKIKYYDYFVDKFNKELKTLSKEFNEDPEIVKKILMELISRESLSPVKKNKTKSMNRKNKLKSNNKNNLSDFCRIIYYSDNFFEISVAILSYYLSSSDGIISKEEKSFISSYGNLNKKEKNIIEEVWNGKHSYVNDKIIIKLFQKKFKNNREIYLSLIDNLFAVAESDRDITKNEINFIEKISKKLGINNDEFQQILNNKLDNIKSNKKSDRSLIDDEDFDEIDEFLEDLEDLE